MFGGEYFPLDPIFNIVNFEFIFLKDASEINKQFLYRFLNSDKFSILICKRKWTLIIPKQTSPNEVRKILNRYFDFYRSQLLPKPDKRVYENRPPGSSRGVAKSYSCYWCCD